MPNLHDTPDGQTHHESDGCGEPAHNPLPKTNEELLKKWREVFIEWNRNPDGEPLDEMAEKFWWDVLAEQRKEWVESVRKEIEANMKPDEEEIEGTMQSRMCLKCNETYDFGKEYMLFCWKDGGEIKEQTVPCTTHISHDWENDIIRDKVLSLPSLTTDSEECGTLIHTRGFGGMEGPIYCAQKKPCKVHGK